MIAGIAQAQPLSIGKLSIRLNARRGGSDTLSLSGSVPMPAGFSAAGQNVSIYVGGVGLSGTLSGQSGALSAGSTRLTLRGRGSTLAPRTFSFSFSSKGALASQFADEGLTPDATQPPKPIAVILLLNGAFFTQSVPVSFNRKTGQASSGR